MTSKFATSQPKLESLKGRLEQMSSERPQLAGHASAGSKSSVHPQFNVNVRQKSYQHLSPILKHGQALQNPYHSSSLNSAFNESTRFSL